MNSEALQTFLETAFPEIPSRTYAHVFSLPQRDSHFFTDPRLVGDFVAAPENSQSDIYIGLGLRGEDLGPHRRGDYDEVIGIVALGADVDVGGPYHTKPNLPPTPEAALALIHAFPLPYTVLVWTGGGYQPWWVFKEPWVFDSSEERDKVASLSAAWQATLREIAHIRSYDIDSVGDLARVLRLPGTINNKYGTMVAVESADGPLYGGPLDFEDQLLTPPKPIITGSFSQYQTTPLILNPSAEPPAGFEAVLADPKISATWNHVRKDLQDQSASGYDMSLANLLVMKEMSDQEVTDTVIAMRRLQGDDLKLRTDYYQGMLMKARNGHNPNSHNFNVGNEVNNNIDDASVGDTKDTTSRFSVGGSYSLTDAGNAEMFADLYRDTFRFDHRRGSWNRWGEHWWEYDKDQDVVRKAIKAARERFRLASDIPNLKEKEAAAKWSIGSENRSRIEATLKLAQAQPPLATTGEEWDKNLMLLGVANGVVDLGNGVLRAGSRDDLITMHSDVHYDAVAKCPRWEGFLAEVFNEDKALIDWLWRAIGYSVTGLTSEQVAFLLYGLGWNGKSTLLRVLVEVLGHYATNAAFSTFEAGPKHAIPNDVAALAGKRLVTASEVREGASLNISRIKSFVGEDILTARFLYGEVFTFRPQLKLWLAVNHRPRVADDSEGFWRKIRLIPFTQSFKGRTDKNLEASLKAEYPGILRWIIEGCLEWQQRGLDPPDIVIAATAEYQEESDILGPFLSERCIEAKDATLRAGVLYGAYCTWADDQNLSKRERLSSTAFGRKMSERYTKHQDKKGAYYTGIGLEERS